ncbi:hypothetical protein C8T65DRAFT_665301 [Cerioporus squamosus]|nr:hypothetical protein C8T65DRAFT_665301 [Cerioporus squamosus]
MPVGIARKTPLHRCVIVSASSTCGTCPRHQGHGALLTKVHAAVFRQPREACNVGFYRS